MPDFLARAIALLVESLLWGLVGLFMAFQFGLYESTTIFGLVVLGFALLGPPLWRRFGLPKWYKGP